MCVKFLSIQLYSFSFILVHEFNLNEIRNVVLAASWKLKNMFIFLLSFLSFFIGLIVLILESILV